MGNRRAYERKSTALWAWALKAFGLVIATAAIVMVMLTITRGVSRDSGMREGGGSAGHSHEATAITPPADTRPDVPAPAEGPGQESASDTVVQNGVTIVSPPLLKPVIDLASLEPASVSHNKASAKKTTSTRKRPRYAKRSPSRRQTQWKAYGLVIR